MGKLGMDRKSYNSCTWFELRSRIKSHQRANSESYDRQFLLFRQLYWVTLSGFADHKWLKKQTPEKLWPLTGKKKRIIRKNKAQPLFIPLHKDKERLRAMNERFNPKKPI